MGNLLYTNIQHGPRKKHNLTMNEYVLCDMIYQLSNNPKYDWCCMTKENMSIELGVTKRTILSLIEKLIKKGFIIKSEKTKHLKTTELWYNEMVIYGEESIPEVKNNTSTLVKKVHQLGEESIPNNNIINIDINNSNVPDLKNDDNEDKSETKMFKENSFEYKASSYMFEHKKHLIKSLVDKKGKENILQDWSNTVDKMKRLDGISEDNIREIIKFATFDGFWSKNVYSMNKFRMKNKEGLSFYQVFINKLGLSDNDEEKSDEILMWELIKCVKDDGGSQKFKDRYGKEVYLRVKKFKDSFNFNKNKQ